MAWSPVLLRHRDCGSHDLYSPKGITGLAVLYRSERRGSGVHIYGEEQRVKPLAASKKVCTNFLFMALLI